MTMTKQQLNTFIAEVQEVMRRHGVSDFMPYSDAFDDGIGTELYIQIWTVDDKQWPQATFERLSQDEVLELRNGEEC